MITPVDAHNHIFNSEISYTLYNSYDIKGIKEITEINQKFKNIGIHPMFLSELIDWDYIESLLIDNSSINIGEVGLDRRGDRKQQEPVFKSFLDFAVKYNRSVSIHCVKSWGIILESLNSIKVPLLFHGYNGSKEILKSLLKLNSYFSFSLRELNNPRIVEVCKYIPIEKQLIESDYMEDYYNKIGKEKYLNVINEAMGKLSLINSMPLKDFNYIIIENFLRFIKGRQ